jgi:hypothetical protein
MKSRSRLTGLLLATLFFGATMMACPAWGPIKKGTCNPGRKWSEPQKQGSDWKAGSCNDSE